MTTLEYVLIVVIVVLVIIIWFFFHTLGKVFDCFLPKLPKEKKRFIFF